MEFGTLAADKTIHGIKFKAGTEVEFYESGHVSSAYFEEDTTFTVKGVAYMGGEATMSVASVSFFENGKVREGTLASDTIIHGVKFAGGTEIHFCENGKVSGGTLAEELTYSSGEQIDAGAEVERECQN